MPYAGGVYTIPPGTLATTLTPIDSSDYNSFVSDIEAAQNSSRPVVAGGTGAQTVIGAWDALAKKGTDIATASSINLTTATGPSLSLTGVVTVTSVTLAEGSIRVVRAAAAFQITASASLLCNGSSTVPMSVLAEDILIFRGGASSVVSVAKITLTTLTNASISSSTIALKQATDPSPTAEGDIQWSTLYDAIKVGDGAGTKRFPYGPAPGALYGCTLSNNGSDATNDIDIASGQAADSTNALYLRLVSGIAKQLDANWAVGTNQGGLDTGAIANTTYHVFLIMRSDTGVVDVLFSASPTGPVMPTNYDYKRRIGSIVRSGGAIVAFTQVGDIFNLNSVSASSSNPTSTSAVTNTLAVPIGVVVRAILYLGMNFPAQPPNAFLLATALFQTDVLPSVSNYTIGTAGASANVDNQTNGTYLEIQTNTSGQIRTRLSSANAGIAVLVSTVGWIDNRGRL